MFGFVHCNASIVARQNTDPDLFFVRILVKNWLWPIITCFGVTGNILAIIVLTKRRMIMSSTNNYLATLALADIVYLVLTLLLNTLQDPCFRNTSLSAIVSTICRPIADFSSNTSVWLTVTFTVERWVAITYPLQSRTWCTVNQARRVIASVVCASLLCTLPSVFEVKLVRIVERKNISNELIYTSHIKAQPTALGSSLLYHQIYFNFVTFAIIWIPLVLLLFFNTILISYVRRSKQSIQRNTQGIELRRHNRGNQGEQRKSTIMLIAVVIVFTVCQIPQAISLTLQSFFHKLAQTSKVLIYNNFANCLVAVNASINFVLYCCFSDRFRSTFRANFTFLSKYCVPYIQPEWIRQSTNRQDTLSNSLDNISATNYSMIGTQSNTHLSNLSTDNSTKHTRRMKLKPSQLPEKKKLFWFFRLTIFSSKSKTRTKDIQLKETDLLANTESMASSPTTSLLKSPTFLTRTTPTSNVSTSNDRVLHLPIDAISAKQKSSNKTSSVIPLKRQSFSLHGSDQAICKSKFHPTSYSYRSLIDTKIPNEQIWIRRHQSEQLLNRTKSFPWKEIIDVTV